MGEVGWISIMMAGYGERSYWMKPMDDYLYGGLAGVAVFFAELAEWTGKEEHRQMRKALVDALFRHTDGLLQRDDVSREEPRMAWCHGWRGIVMARMEAERYAEGAFKEDLGKVRDFVRRKVRDGVYRGTAVRKLDFFLCHGRCGNQALLAYLGKLGTCWRFMRMRRMRRSGLWI